MDNDGFASLAQLYRISVPVKALKALGWFVGWSKNYNQAKELMASFPKEKRKAPIYIAGRVLIIAPNDMTKEEMKKSLEEFITSRL